MAGHGELMDKIYHTQRHFYDATRKYYLLGRDGLIADLAPPSGGSVLEIGCGTGRNLIAVGLAWPQAELFGIDISDAMLETARGSLAKADVAATLVRGDACGFDATALFGRATFDRVFISYALSMIPDWEKAIDAALAALKPGGSLHIVDFGQQERLPRWFGRMLQAWLLRFHVTPRATLRDVLADKADTAGGRLEFEPIGRGYAWHAVIRT